MDEDDSDDNDPNVCSDGDGDDCDDCSSGTFDPNNDGNDNESDGLCIRDPDDDNDTVLDTDDSDPFNKFVCQDLDDDTCDDCSSGTYNELDGFDYDGDEYDTGDNT